MTVNLGYSGTASGFEYSASSSINVAAWNTTGTTSITSINDNKNEGNETIIVDLTTVVNGSESGTQQVICTITDDDAGQTLTFAIVAGDQVDNFLLDSQSGILYVNNASVLDFENLQSLYLTISVSDDNEVAATSNSVITINLTDVNERPVIFDQRFTIAENSDYNAVVGTIMASDPEDMNLTYFLSSSMDGNPFVIDSSTGEISVANTALPDFEMNEFFSFEIEVQDTSLTSRAQITVELTNINDNLPVLVEGTFSVDEDAEMNSPVGTIEISDKDGDLGNYSVEIVSGNTNDAFTVDPYTMEITVNMPDAIDFEAKALYEIIIYISDGVNSTEATVRITVNDVIETFIEADFADMFEAYPVPAHNYLYIRPVGNAEIQWVKLVGVKGDIILTEKGTNIYSEYVLDVSGIVSGNYMLYVVSKNEIYTKKIIIE